MKDDEVILEQKEVNHEQGRREINLASFFLGFYVSIYYLKNQIICDKL